mgnify:FL=1
METKYQQSDRNYCLPYSFASGLFYCGFEAAAEEITVHANYLSLLPSAWALHYFKNMMLSLAPLIGCSTTYNIRGKKKMNVDQLVKQFTPYPTIVIPVGKNGYCSHSICVVDNLIFDAITHYAL